MATTATGSTAATDTTAALGPQRVTAVIGDLVASRSAPDRAGLHRDLEAALAASQRLVPALQPLALTAGDEFQGAYATPAQALLAALVVRLRLLPAADVRCGVGTGTTTVFDAARTPPAQDGPAWWAARSAVEEAARRGARARTRTCRTWCADADTGDGAGGGPGGAATANAFLSCRDDVLARMGPRALRLTEHLLLGRSQAEMAAAEGVTQSAVSQALARSGATTVVDAHRLLLAGDRG